MIFLTLFYLALGLGLMLYLVFTRELSGRTPQEISARLAAYHRKIEHILWEEHKNEVFLRCLKRDAAARRQKWKDRKSWLIQTLSS